MKYIDLFAGVGGIRIPFDELGYQCVVSSEWDKAPCAAYEANFVECPQGDITQIEASTIPPHDLLLAGLPCQAFSIMGKMAGFVDSCKIVVSHQEVRRQTGNSVAVPMIRAVAQRINQTILQANEHSEAQIKRCQTSAHAGTLCAQ